jgi:hypothetical protein
MLRSYEQPLRLSRVALSDRPNCSILVALRVRSKVGAEMKQNLESDNLMQFDAGSTSQPVFKEYVRGNETSAWFFADAWKNSLRAVSISSIN